MFLCSLASFLFSLQVSAESASQFGELVADPVTNELLHYTEKPETFVCAVSAIQLLFGEFSIFCYFFECFNLMSALALISCHNAGK